MEQPSVERKFRFDHELNSHWTVDNNPLRFPNARNYKDLRIRDNLKIITIDIRRDVFKNCLTPSLNSLVDVLQRNTKYPICLTISWEAVAFTKRKDVAPPSPPWREPIGPLICPNSIELLKPYINILIDNIHRWKALRIFSPIITRMEPEFSRIPAGGAPSLQSLILMDVEHYDEIKDLFPILLSIREYSKNFRELLFFDNRNRACGSRIPDPFCLSLSRHFPFMPYDWLTSLRLDYKLSAADALAMLNRGSRLVECVFSSLTGATLLPDGIRLATCSSLHYLKLSNYEGDFANYKSTGTLYSLLKNISTPNLKRLVLQYEDQWDMDAFAIFITQSSCNLDELHIIKMGIDAEGLVACLELAGDSLIELLLEERTRLGLTRHFIKHLAYEDPRRHDRNRACLCPNLQVVSIGDFSLDGSGNFGRALSSRIGVTPLEKVKILATDILRNGENIPERDIKGFEELKRQGIDVYLVRDPCDGL